MEYYFGGLAIGRRRREHRNCVNIILLCAVFILHMSFYISNSEKTRFQTLCVINARGPEKCVYTFSVTESDIVTRDLH